MSNLAPSFLAPNLSSNPWRFRPYDCRPEIQIPTPLCLRAAGRPFEGLDIFEVSIGEQILTVRYEHARWWFIHESACGDVVAEHACASAHRAVILMLRRLRALGFY